MNNNGLKKTSFYHGQHNNSGYSTKTTAAALEKLTISSSYSARSITGFCDGHHWWHHLK